MKFITLLCFIISFPLFASNDEIITKDMNNAEVTSMTSLESSSSITPEEMESLKKQLEKAKENQQISEDLLNELEEEQ